MSEVEVFLKRLTNARKKAKRVREEISVLRQSIIDAGANPDPWKVDNTNRNKSIFMRWKEGAKFTEIAKEYNLSSTTISNICNRVKRVLEQRKGKIK